MKIVKLKTRERMGMMTRDEELHRKQTWITQKQTHLNIKNAPQRHTKRKLKTKMERNISGKTS